MKPTYKPFLTSALALATTIPAMAQSEDETTEQQELVTVAFRKVAAEDLLGGTSSIDVEELMEKNNMNVQNPIDNLQGYVGGWNGSGLWGYSDHLILIDGVPRQVENIKPTEIKDITFLKGAQAVILYGAKAAKGAILITTKRGNVGDLRINVKANTGWNVAKSYPEYLHSAEYMTLYNEARRNDGLSDLYTQNDIYNTSTGANPYRYPDVNFYSSDYIKKAYNQTDVVAEVTAGNRVAKFYSNVSYYRVGDYLDFGNAKKNYTDRFDVRGNVDLRLSDYVSGFVNAAVTFYNQKTAIGSDYWTEATTFRPNRLSPLIPLSYIDPTAKPALSMIGASNNIIDGKYFLGAGSTEADFKNVFSDYYAAGRNNMTSRQFQFDAGIDIDLQKVLKGLSFHTQMSIDYKTSYNTSYSDTYATFTPTWSQANGVLAIIGSEQHYEDKHSGVQNIGNSASDQTVAFNAHFDYNRTFDEVHNVSAMLLANSFVQTKSGSSNYHNNTNANLGFTADYNYAHKYYANVSLATPWSTKLPVRERLGLSQSYTFGWNIARESWLEDKGIDYLKLSRSWSIIKTDLGIDEYYMYLGNYTSTGWWDWGGSGVSATASTNGGNLSLGYIERREVSVNLQGSVLNKRLWFDASWFMSDLDGQLITNDNVAPSYFKSYYPEGQFYSYINYNNDRRTGFDVSVNYKQKFGEVEFQAGASATYFTTEKTRRDDTQIADEYQKATGRYLDGLWGYECLGFFKDQADIDNNPSQTSLGEVHVGDLKYKDQNGDGKIDGFDKVELGKSAWPYGSPLTLGVNLTAKWKGLTLFVLGTGNFGGKAMKNNSYWWSGASENKYSAAVRDRAIVKDGVLSNPNTARYPALTTKSGSNSFQDSDFWMYKTDRFNLAKVQLTYDFCSELFENNKVVRGLSVYASGSNLLTIAPEREILEMNVGSAPQSRFYNIGLTVKF